MLKNLLQIVKKFVKFQASVKKPVDMSSDIQYDKIVWVRKVNGERKMTAKFTYRLPARGNAKEGKLRIFNLERLVTEPISETIMRLECNIVKQSTKAKKRKQPEQESAIDETSVVKINLFDEKDFDVDGRSPNAMAWVDRGTLQIGDIRYMIRINAPTILKLELPSIILCGFPLLPYLTSEFTDISQSEFTWLRVCGDSEHIAVCHGMLYTPTQEDIGHNLKVVVLPKHNGEQGEVTEIVSSTAVEKGPTELPFLSRQSCTATETSVER